MLIELIARSDWLSLASLSISGIGIVCSLWMIADCIIDRQVVERPAEECPWPSRCCHPTLRRELATMHLRNEIIRLSVQVVLGVIVIVTVSMPPMLPTMRNELIAHPTLPWLLLGRMALRTLVSVLMTMSAVLDLRYRHRLRSADALSDGGNR